MQKLLQVLEKYYIVFLFLILELVGFSLLVRYNTYHQISYLSWANDLTGGVYQQLSNVTDHVKLAEVNKNLAHENAVLKQRLSESYLNTSNKFNPWVDTNYHQNYVYRTAQIINNQLSATNNFMMINKGKLSGVLPKMGVINSTGIVGIVTDVSNHYAVVMSVLNPDLNLGVRLKKTDYFGILSWDGENTTQAVLHNIQGFVKIQKGDTLETIGASGIFPEGIMVGTIESFAIDEESNNWEIRVDLSANIQQARHVDVLENIFSEEIEQLENPEND